MDRTILNLASLLLGGAGIFAVFTEYSVPELHATAIGSNPFARKAEIIKTVMAWIFTGVAILALLIQAGAEIAGDRLPERRYTICVYCCLFAVGIVATGLFVVGLAAVGLRKAKARWWPEMVNSQRGLFASARSIVDHDGWREDQLRSKDGLTDPDKCRNANLEQAEGYVAQIERLLGLDALPTAKLAQRVARLTTYFGS